MIPVRSGFADTQSFGLGMNRKPGNIPMAIGINGRVGERIILRDAAVGMDPQHFSCKRMQILRQLWLIDVPRSYESVPSGEKAILPPLSNVPPGISSTMIRSFLASFLILTTPLRLFVA